MTGDPETLQIVTIVVGAAGTIAVMVTAVLIGLQWRAAARQAEAATDQAKAARQQAQAATDQAEASLRSARAMAWIEAQRVFTTKIFERDGRFTWSLGTIRGKVMALQRPVPASEWEAGAEGVSKEEALDVCRGMCEVADLVVFGGLDLEIVLQAWGDPFRKTWIALRPLVREQRHGRSWALLWERFQIVGEAALKRFGWPDHWRKPNAEILEQNGWDWRVVGPKARSGNATSSPPVASS